MNSIFIVILLQIHNSHVTKIIAMTMDFIIYLDYFKTWEQILK